MGSFLERSPVKRHSLVVVLSSLIRKSHTGMAVEIHRIERAQPQGTFEILDGALWSRGEALNIPEAVPRPGGVWIERERALQQYACGSEVTQDGMHRTEHRENERIIAAQLSRPFGQCPC